MYIFLDFETFSVKNIKKYGAYAYAQHPEARIIIACWCIDDSDVRYWDIRQPPPSELIRAILRGGTIVAHNAEFEYLMLVHTALRSWDISLSHLPISQFYCTAAVAAVSGLPRSLAGVTKALGVPQLKSEEGSRLINMFCTPRGVLGQGVVDCVDWKEAILEKIENHKEDWDSFVAYGEKDVLAHRAVFYNRPRLGPTHQRAWELTVNINTRGLPVDIQNVNRALRVVEKAQEQANEDFKKITGFNITRTQELKRWLGSEDVQRGTLENLLKDPSMAKEERKAIKLRLQAGRAAVKKLPVLANATVNGRMQGGFLFYGARTGRWSGRIFQPQNIARGFGSYEQKQFFEHLERDEVFQEYEDPIGAVASSMRGFIRAPRGTKFLVADYAAIEARVLCWLAGQEDAIEEYRQGIDAYKSMAAYMYGIDVSEVNKEQRFVGKQTILGCGYQMGWKRFKVQAEKFGVNLSYEVAAKAVNAYRAKYNKVQDLWYSVEMAFRNLVLSKLNISITNGKLTFSYDPETKFIKMQLPSGRNIYYYEPRIEAERIKYMANYKVYVRSESSDQPVYYAIYGGKLVENAVQAIARDIMIHGMYNVDKEYPVIATIHDELISEVLEFKATQEDVDRYCRLICETPEWGKGIPLKAEGFVCDRYVKG